jgi:hypothetical protein
MMPTNSFSWMKVLLIAALLTVDMPGLYVAERLPGKLSFAMAKGG